MASNNKLAEVKNLVEEKKLKDAYLKANQIIIEHIDNFLEKFDDSIDNKQSIKYNKLKNILKNESNIPSINQKKYFRSLLIRIVSGVVIFGLFTALIIIFNINWILIFGILIPVILFYVTLFLFEERRVKFQKPEYWISEILALKDQLSPDYTYSGLDCEIIKLELLNRYRFWIISMKKYGYLVLND